MERADYIKNQEEKDKQIQNILRGITENIQSNKLNKKMIYGITKDSYIVQFIIMYLKDITLMEIDKHINLYKTIFQLIQNLICDELIGLLDIQYVSTNLFKCLESLNKMINIASSLVTAQTNPDNETFATIQILFEMAHPLYIEFIKNKPVVENPNNVNNTNNTNNTNNGITENYGKYNKELYDLRFLQADITQKESKYYYSSKFI